MNISTIGKTLGNCMKGAFIGLLAIAAVSCKSDEKVDTTVPFDPTRPSDSDRVHSREWRLPGSDYCER